jgi:hypothetical protein
MEVTGITITGIMEVTGITTTGITGVIRKGIVEPGRSHFIRTGMSALRYRNGLICRMRR